MSVELLADADASCREKLKECNRAARRLVAEAGAAAKPNAVDAMSVDVDRLLSLSLDVVDAISHLRSAHTSLDSLKRRH